MSTRDRIFRSIEEALRGGTKIREPNQLHPRVPRIAQTTTQERVSFYLEAVKRNGIRASLFDTPLELASWCVGLCQGLKARRIYVAGGDAWSLVGDTLRSALADTGCTLFRQEDSGEESNHESRHFLRDCDIAVTEAWGGCIDSGTAIITSGPSEARGASVLPPTHVLLLHRERIADTMEDHFERMREIIHAENPAAITFIGGPSRTSDIEKVLVTGVHGPGALYLCLY